MKKYLNFSLVLSLIFSAITLTGCKDGKTTEAEKTVREYIEQLGCEIDAIEYSKLYIAEPSAEDAERLAKEFQDRLKEITSIEKRMEVTLKHISSMSNPVDLVVNGVTVSVIDNTIDNNVKFREDDVNAGEYAMVAFFTEKDNGQEMALYIRMTEELNIYKHNSIKPDMIDYAYCKMIDYDESRKVKATKAKYDDILGRYNRFFEKIKDNTSESDIDDKFSYIKRVNELFEYERYKIHSDKRKTVKECIQNYDYRSDKRELMDVAAKYIKSL